MLTRAQIHFLRLWKQSTPELPRRHLSYKKNVSYSVAPIYKNNIVTSEYANATLPNQDIFSFMLERWEKWSDKDALECISTGRIVTYGEFINQSLRFGAALHKLVPNSSESDNISDIPKVSIMSPNVIEYLPTVFGTLAAGWVLNTINSNYKVGEIEHILKDVKPNVLVVHSSLEDVTDEALRNLKMSIPVLSIGASKRAKPNMQQIIEDKKGEKINFKQVKPSTPAFILYSGGTTGLPKGVVLPHSAVTNNVICITDPRIHAFGYGENTHITVTALMPFYHIYGMHVVSMMNLSVGSKILVFQEFDPLTYGDIISKYKIKFLHQVPTLLNFVINSGRVTRQQLETVRGVIIAGAPVLPAAANAIRNMTNQDIIFQEGFGLTETLGTHLTPHTAVRIGFCGKLIPFTEAKIIDTETQKNLGPNHRGEICLKSPSMMSHYLNNPKATAETIDADGFLHTGDIATYTEDGFFSIIDRIKDIIKVKSFQVSPAEIEDALMEHPAVAEAGVVGVPNERTGECPRAYITLKGKATEEEIIKYIENRLSSIKRLTGGVKFVSELPKSQAGKILRRDLKELAMKDLKK